MNTMATEIGRRTGKLCIYHPRKDGNGAALQLDMRLNSGEEKRYDCFFLSVANQKGTQELGGRRVASFDWDGKSIVKLGFSDICELLAVCEGRKESAGNGKGGLFHSSGDGNTVVGFARSTEVPGFNLSVSRKSNAGEQVFRCRIFLSDPEVIGLHGILQTGLFFLTFHHDLGLGGHAYAVSGNSV